MSGVGTTGSAKSGSFRVQWAGDEREANRQAEPRSRSGRTRINQADHVNSGRVRLDQATIEAITSRPMYLFGLVSSMCSTHFVRVSAHWNSLGEVIIKPGKIIIKPG